MPADLARTLRRRIKQDGYFPMPEVLTAAEIAPLLAGIETLRQHGWLPVYCYVYDEYWQVFWRFHDVLSQLMGEDYKQLPAIWSWYLEPTETAAGWRPHRDRGVFSLRDDLSPTSFSIWLPLTDAGPENGCMYVVPAHADVTYFGFSHMEPLLQDARALPTPAGSAYCWTHALLHWGSSSSNDAPNPRVSLSFEYQAIDVDSWEDPLLVPTTLPGFEARIALICKGLLQYRHMHKVPIDEADTAMAAAIRDRVLGLIDGKLPPTA
jgi:hypothetical protein